MHLLASRIKADCLTLRDDTGVNRFGDRDCTANEIEIVVHDPSAYEQILRGGSSALGRQYALGAWDTNDLTECLRLLLRATRPILAWHDKLARRPTVLMRQSHKVPRPDAARDRDNIRAHYDLSNEFFELMLDPTMAYSCGIFANDNTTLETASISKFERVCNTLNLSEDHHIIEIGTGWAGFAIYAARNRGCRVTTTTISQQQFEYAEKRVADEGLADRITVAREHYRDLHGVYDALVSIEMIEAVPWPELDDYFAMVRRLLAPGAPAVIQAITINEASYERSKRHNDYIKQCIFPGSNLPSLAAMQESAHASDLHLDDLHDIGAHYPPTLRAWGENVRARRNEIAVVAPHLDHDEFRRQWDFYLAYCEAAFLERHISVVQTTWTMRGTASAGLRSNGGYPQ